MTSRYIGYLICSNITRARVLTVAKTPNAPGYLICLIVKNIIRCVSTYTDMTIPVSVQRNSKRFPLLPETISAIPYAIILAYAHASNKRTIIRILSMISC